MKFVIFYFSGTGNTELISEEIKKRLEMRKHCVELLSIEDKNRIEDVSLTDTVIGFGFPVYKFSYPEILNNLFECLSPRGGNKCFQFSTYARFTAESFRDFSRKLESNNFHLIAEESFKAPSCGIAARRDKSDFEYESVMFFEDDIDKKIDGFVQRILDSFDTGHLKLKHSHSFLNSLKLKVVKEIEQTKYPELQIDDNRCGICGLCAEHCPENNLLMRERGIEIKDKYGCLHCLRCMNHCPSNAVNFGELTVGENRYTIQLRNKLFDKAASGYKEKHWENFEEIRKEWRKNTLRYWRTHRNNPV